MRPGDIEKEAGRVETRQAVRFSTRREVLERHVFFTHSPGRKATRSRTTQQGHLEDGGGRASASLSR